MPGFNLRQAQGYPRLFFRGRYDPLLWRPASDFKNKLGPDRFLEFLAILDRHHEGAWPPDHAILVVEIEVVDIHRRIGRLLHHDGQAVDGDAFLQRRVARAGDGRAVVVRSVAGDIDDAPQPAIWIFIEQRHRETYRARNRGS